MIMIPLLDHELEALSDEELISYLLELDADHLRRLASRFRSVDDPNGLRVYRQLCRVLSLRWQRSQFEPEPPPPAPSAMDPDWTREDPRRFWDPSRRLLKSIRQYARCCRGGRLRRFWRYRWVWSHRWWSIVCACDIPLTASSSIWGGLILLHPVGVVIHPKATVGPNCTIGPSVVIGAGPGGALPSLGGNVNVGAGAVILGPAQIGDGAWIGAGAVVIRDVPAGRTAVGCPARIIETDPAAGPAGRADPGTVPGPR